MRIRSQTTTRVLLVVAVATLLALPLQSAAASAPTASAAGPVVKVGMIAPITSPTAANPDQGEAFKAAVAAFNKRGGLGTNGAKMQADVCDTKGDANGEVDCARKMVDEGVVATVNDLAYNNPSGVDEVLAATPASRASGSVRPAPSPTTSLTYPISTGIVGAYEADAVGFEDRRQDEGRARADRRRRPAAASRRFISPPFKAAGVDIVGDVAIATGSTDYAPYVADIQRSDPDAVLLAIDDTVSRAAHRRDGSSSTTRCSLGGHPGTFTLETLRKFKDITKGTLLAESFPYPSQNNVKNFPGLKQFFADMKASGQDDPRPEASSSRRRSTRGSSTLAFVNVHQGARHLHARRR